MRFRKLPPALLLALLLVVAQASAKSVKNEAYVKDNSSQKVEINNAKTQKTTNTTFQAAQISPVKTVKHENIVTTSKDIVTTNNTASSEVISFNGDIFGTGFFYGITVMVILINLLCFLLFSDKVYGYFAISVTAISVLMFSTDGLITLLFESLASFSAQIETTLLVLATVGLSVFSSKFLNLSDFQPKLKSMTIPLLGLAGMLSVISWFIDNTTFMMAASLISFTVLLAYFTAGIMLFSTKNYAKFYVIGFSIPLLFSIDYFLLGGLGIHFIGTQSIHVKVAIGIQMLLMTYAIVYRMQAIKDETILRQTEMKIFLERQEAMSRDNLAQMMQDVYLENLIMQYDLDGIEIKLLQYISEDKTNEKIARKLNTTVIEVEEMTKELYHKLEIGEAIKLDYRMLEAQPDYLYN